MSKCRTPVFAVKQGDSWSRRFVWFQADKPVNLRFSIAVFQLKDMESKEVLAEASTFNGNLVVKEDIGVVDVWLDIPEDAEPKIYIGELEVRYIDGTKQSSPIIFVQVLEDVVEFGEAKTPKDKTILRPVPSLVKKRKYG